MILLVSGCENQSNLNNPEKLPIEKFPITHSVKGYNNNQLQI